MNAWGKFPSCRLVDGVVLLGEQAEVVAEVEQTLEQLARLTDVALAR